MHELDTARRIVFGDCEIASLYFPVGDPADGGTCAYATEECLENCPSCGVTNEHEVRALKFFRENDAKTIADRITRELTDTNQTLLQWNCWGDCLPELTEKTSTIMQRLYAKGLWQYGFTRNLRLWEITPRYDRLRIGLSVDSEDEAIERSANKLVCFPLVEEGMGQFFFGSQMVARCSGYWCTWLPEGHTHNSVCKLCIKHRRGCFEKPKVIEVDDE